MCEKIWSYRFTPEEGGNTISVFCLSHYVCTYLSNPQYSGNLCVYVCVSVCVSACACACVHVCMCMSLCVCMCVHRVPKTECVPDWARNTLSQTGLSCTDIRCGIKLDIQTPVGIKKTLDEKKKIKYNFVLSQLLAIIHNRLQEKCYFAWGEQSSSGEVGNHITAPLC